MWVTLAVLLAVGAAAGARAGAGEAACPVGCACSTTPEGLHRAACAGTLALLKFSLQNKRHNLNILDLSRAKIAKLNGDLDRFTEVVSVDLSYNRIKYLDKLLRNSKKLVHLNLRRNLMRTFSAATVPASVSSLDLRENLLSDVPADLHLLSDLEHLELEGNPIDCSCDNLRALDAMRNKGVVVDDVKCTSPPGRKGQAWAQIKVADACFADKKPAKNVLLEDMMLGDEPYIDSDSDSVRRKKSELDQGEMWESSGSGDTPNDRGDDDDEKMFITVSTPHSGREASAHAGLLGAKDGSGDGFDFEATTKDSGLDFTTEYSEGSGDSGSGAESSTASPTNETLTTADPAYDEYEGSGDDSENITTTTQAFITGYFNPYFDSALDISTSTSEPFTYPNRPTVFMGTIDWDATASEEVTSARPVVVDEVIKRKENKDVDSVPVVKQSEPTLVTHEEQQQERENKPLVKSSLGTYICIGILIFILVGLIVLATVRGQIRKRRDRRLMRQQRKDIEKAGKEMVDMNKSLLGKTAIVPNESEKKLNGTYELVPTHDVPKTNGNGNLDNRKSVEEPVQRAAAPARDLQAEQPRHSRDAPKDEPRVNLVPLKSEPDAPLTNGHGHQLEPLPSEPAPAYSPGSGRVRIKLTETPKPKTPVLITRSRSNAGDIVITPALDQSPSRKSAT